MTEHDSKTIMTEQELLAAPEDDYMSPRQLAFFHQRLVEQQQELMQSAELTLSQLREQPQMADEADRASAEEEYALALRIQDRERQLLRKIQQAILRIERGEDYGWCEETGDPIGLRRLLARPTATLSVDGQERKEAQGKAFSDRRASS